MQRPLRLCWKLRNPSEYGTDSGLSVQVKGLQNFSIFASSLGSGAARTCAADKCSCRGRSDTSGDSDTAGPALLSVGLDAEVRSGPRFAATRSAVRAPGTCARCCFRTWLWDVGIRHRLRIRVHCTL